MPPLWFVAAALLLLAQCLLPPRWAFVPLWIAACHTPYTAFLGGITICRLVMVAGLVRAVCSPTRPAHPSTRPATDSLVAAMALVLVASAVAHEASPIQHPLTQRLRMAFDLAGAYTYMRCWTHPPDAARRWAQALCWILIPFAALLLLESTTGINPYRWIGSEHLLSQVREGRIRAQGPFGTPILSGTVGAVCLPLMLTLWHTHRNQFFAALAACLTIVLASGSSGPISSLLVSLAVLAGWRWRHATRTIATAVALGLLVLHAIKERPVWYLMALMDFVGGSTGWHRAYLIDTALAHFDEWWLSGCDRTSHWMPYALAAVPNHCDLTNYYLHLGVTAGIVPIALLIAILLRCLPPPPTQNALLHWCLTATLMTHAVTFLSISYFDQMGVFFWALLGAIPVWMRIELQHFIIPLKKTATTNG